MLETIPESAVWAIFGLPLASLLIIVFLPKSMAKYAGHVAALAIGIAFMQRAVEDPQRQQEGDTDGQRGDVAGMFRHRLGQENDDQQRYERQAEDGPDGGLGDRLEHPLDLPHDFDRNVRLRSGTQISRGSVIE